ncbi:MAG: [CysO sulfur-carrier protein]-S-L-cysteine hydrolase [Baekduia sp.]|jgi:proteasome lid subunit RPN8/RPN11|nr:[CysO sulfur-carrier protein]-S-L-cysteine hydrolase [Baekduia sp.]
MQIAPDLLQQIVDHAVAEAPYECCGYIVLDGDRAVDVVAVENVSRSPLRFDMDPQAVLAMGKAYDDGGVVIYHSHTRSEPRPSQTDMNFAAQWPGVEWLIVGTAGDEPVVRNWRIENGTATEVEVLSDAGV